jgi:CubicO group peptidase (beta-lactamase class C family)
MIGVMVDSATDSHELTDLLRSHASVHSVPGAALGILSDGVLTTAYHGVADAITRQPVTAETRFAVGSLGKPMAATVALRVADTGLYSLDDPVAAHVPELAGVDWAGRSTVRDLLASRSGLPLSLASEFAAWPDDDDGVLSRVAAGLATREPSPPHWSYSNAGWCLVGRAMETVTGRVWEDAVQRYLLDPFGLSQTTFTTWPSGVPAVSGHQVVAGVAEPVARWAPRNLGPAGSTLLSTVTDLLRLAGRHLDEPSLARLRETTAEVRIHAWFDAWCLGWARFDWDGGPVYGWDGLMAGQRAVLRMVPERRGAIALLTNCGTGRSLYRSMFPDLMRTHFGIGMPALRLDPSPGAAGDLARFAGEYAWPDRRWHVTTTDTGLSITSASTTFAAAPIDDQTFLVDADDPDTPTMTFGAFDDDGRPGALYQMLWAHPRART